ncbi:YgiT-type zinc finger protein [Desulfoplanes sp.]
MACPLCKGKMEIGTTILPFEMNNGKVIVILNVPARICEQCGEERALNIFQEELKP